MSHQNNSPFHLAKSQLEKIDDIKDIIANLKLITNGHTQIIESIYEEPLKLKVGEVFIETLSMKILLSTYSIIELTKGVYLEANNRIGTHKLLDFPSINILSRSILEAFLTLEYLFYNDLEDTEKEFRFLIWRISGYKSRQDFFEKADSTFMKNELNVQLANENSEMVDLLEKIKKYPYFNNMNKQELWKLDKFGIPRLNSWSELLENGMLDTGTFSILYKLYSNYAHSEYISLIQMNEAETLNLGSEQNNLHLKNALRMVQWINCVSIIQLKDKFKCTSDAFENLELIQKELIMFWNGFALGKEYHEL